MRVTFYLAHSYARIIYAFRYDKETGALGKRTDFVSLIHGAGIPDGAAMDSKGGYWCAVHALRRKVARCQLIFKISFPSR